MYTLDLSAERGLRLRTFGSTALCDLPPSIYRFYWGLDCCLTARRLWRPSCSAQTPLPYINTETLSELPVLPLEQKRFVNCGKKSCVRGSRLVNPWVRLRGSVLCRCLFGLRRQKCRRLISTSISLEGSGFSGVADSLSYYVMLLRSKQFFFTLGTSKHFDVFQNHVLILKVNFNFGEFYTAFWTH